jgi:hypothetical protein
MLSLHLLDRTSRSSMKTLDFLRPLPWPTFAAAAALLFLTGCSGLTSLSSDVSVPQTLHMNGVVHGGQQPVSGSKVYLYSVGSTNGGASASLLTTAGGYVTTDVNGAFNITGDYTCPSGNTSVGTYLLALGGNPGLVAGTSNSAIALMASLGPCSGLTASTNIWVNEVSTAAAVVALQQFMTDSTHIGALTTATQPGYSAVPSISNAMAVVNNLVSLSTGQAMTAPVNGNGTSPQAKLNTLGNVLASCINSALPTSTACSNLFTAATPSGGTLPTDTIEAMLLIARNPGTNVSAVFQQGTSNAPFQPALSVAPNDFSLAISYTSSGLTNPGPFVVDNAGDVWIANCGTCNGGTNPDAVVGFTPAGALNTNSAGFVLNVHRPVAIGIDPYNAIWVGEASNGVLGNQLTRLKNTDGTVQYPVGNNSAAPTVGFPINLTGTPGGIALIESDFPSDAWVTDSSNGKMTKYKYDGTLLSMVSTTGLSSPTSIVADGLQNLYMIGTNSNSIVQYSAAGTFSSYTGAGLSGPAGLAADGGDHIWTVDQGSSKGVSELLGYTGAATSASNGYSAGINSASSIAIDGAGTAWIANCRVNCSGTGADNIVHLSTSGTSLLPSDGLQSSTLNKPTAVAIDMSGNLWVSSAGSANMTEVVGVATPVVDDLATAASLDALGVVNYLQDGGFEQGTVGSSTVLDWTYSSTLGTSGVASIGACSSNCPFSGNQRLTFYTGTNPFQASESQTISVPNGNYLFSCYVTGNSSVNVSLSATTNGTTSTNTLANLTYGWTAYSIPNIAVTNGSLTVSLNAGGNTGFNYAAFDACSVTQQ